LLSRSPMHVGAWDGVDYGGGASSERQNLDWFQVCSARVYIGAQRKNPSNVGHAHIAPESVTAAHDSVATRTD
jgi:hypothetical protein